MRFSIKNFFCQMTHNLVIASENRSESYEPPCIQFLLLQILSFSWNISHELHILTANSMLKVLVITLFMHEKNRKMKKAFCFDNCSCYNLWKNVSSSDFSFSQVTSVEKRELRGTFPSLGLRPWLQKPFPQFPFFYLGFKNL